MAGPKLTAEDKKFRAKMDLDHLMHAESIRGDPERMRHVQRTAAEQAKALTKVAPKSPKVSVRPTAKRK